MKAGQTVNALTGAIIWTLSAAGSSVKVSLLMRSMRTIICRLINVTWRSCLKICSLLERKGEIERDAR